MKLRPLCLILLAAILCSCTPVSDDISTSVPTVSPSTTKFYDDTYPPLPDPCIDEIYHFNAYTELFDFLNEEIATGSNGLAATPPMQLLLNSIEEKGLWIPYLAEERFQLTPMEGYHSVSLLSVDWYRRSWIYYRRRLENGRWMYVMVTPLEPELEEYAKQATTLQVLQKIHPNIYEVAIRQENIEVYEKKIVTAFGEQTAFVKWNIEQDVEEIKLIQGHWLINLKAGTGILKDEWLKEFELRPFEAQEQA